MARKIPTTKLSPVDDRAVVQRLAADKESAGGIILPDLAQKKANKGLVLRTGPGRPTEDGRERLAMQVKRGDIIVFGQYDGIEQDIDGEKIVIIRERDILAVLESDDTDD